jgi:hypothetical protein
MNEKLCLKINLFLPAYRVKNLLKMEGKACMATPEKLFNFSKLAPFC